MGEKAGAKLLDYTNVGKVRAIRKKGQREKKTAKLVGNFGMFPSSRRSNFSHSILICDTAISGLIYYDTEAFSTLTSPFTFLVSSDVYRDGQLVV